MKESDKDLDMDSLVNELEEDDNNDKSDQGEDKNNYIVEEVKLAKLNTVKSYIRNLPRLDRIMDTMFDLFKQFALNFLIITHNVTKEANLEMETTRQYSAAIVWGKRSQRDEGAL